MWTKLNTKTYEGVYFTFNVTSYITVKGFDGTATHLITPLSKPTLVIQENDCGISILVFFSSASFKLNYTFSHLHKRAQ